MKFLVLGLTPFGPIVVAQAGGETGPVTFTSLGVSGLIAGLCFYLWRVERAERIASESRERELLERCIPLLANAAETLKEVQEGMATVADRPERTALDMTLRRLELAIDEVKGQQGRQGRAK